jgi:Metallopeptidase family M24
MHMLDACIATRKIATDTFTETLREVLATTNPVSEVMVRDMWLEKLRRYESIFPEGWYTPPPHGMFVQFATDSDISRIYRKSNRPPEAWPRDDIFLDRDRGIVSAYTSPVDRTTGMIGDFGITLYFGNKPEIKHLIKQLLEIDRLLFDKVAVGMEISAIATECAKLLKNRGLYNAVASPNDPAGTNIGHGIPASSTGWSQAELKILRSDDWQAAADMIAGKRFFMSTAENHRITANEAFTIEPRPLVKGRPELPMINLHTIVIIKNGRKRQVTGFDKLFDLAGMDYMAR